MLELAASAAADLWQAGEHRTRIAEFEAARRRAAWAPYRAKILRVKTRRDEPTNDRDIIVGFGLRTVDQLGDTTPAVILESVGCGTAPDTDFRARCTSFLSTFNDVNKQIATLAESLTVILDRPSMRFSLAEADRVRALFRAERARRSLGRGAPGRAEHQRRSPDHAGYAPASNRRKTESEQLRHRTESLISDRCRHLFPADLVDVTPLPVFAAL